MKQYYCNITENLQVNKNTFIISCRNEELANNIKPGQFCNIKVNDSYVPLLRRPFSVSDVNGDIISFMITVNGIGTEILHNKKIGEVLDLLGPLGNSFNVSDEFDIAVFVAGGIGVAPFPYLIKSLDEKEIRAYFGFRSKRDIITIDGCDQIISTDDGSFGIKGNVIDALYNDIDFLMKNKVKIFGCGPHPMLKALQKFCLENKIEAEISTESAMACGFGICQGCPIESAHEDSYKLICKDGPIFNVKDVKL